ncbi:site-specific tyrosine recombinase XerC [Botrimarina hoheduenensis]|uniref:Site-specific tyrosine recombinase XerC n=1 Tax=Botrimarina hoheduenensis TaxID=2528000 RepID=A0A5C5WF41_9BACT|nr:site-specific tyrosine recombinase XerC [Botrimarina hoheduenensis]
MVKYRDRANLVLRFRCPLTGKQETRSAGTNQRKQAEKLAAQWEADLRAGRYQRDARMSWQDFREFWEESRLPTLKRSSIGNYAAVFNSFEELCRPKRLADLTTARVTAFTAELRRERQKTVKGPDGKEEASSFRLSEATVAQHLRHLKAVARWAHRQGLLPTVPQFEMPKRAAVAKMKGRPITGEEFERMLDATEGVVGAIAAESWKLLLRGLWWSGLRLGEALALRWDQQPGAVWVMLDGRKSVLAFDAGAQKSGKVELVPLAPEAVELLAPIRRERGYVFAPLKLRGNGAMARDVLKIGKIISSIGAAAGVLVDPATGKTASAHDLRRAFGARWARRVMPNDLRTLMRHASIETTMTYYVGQNAQATAAALWEAVGNIPGNTAPRKTPRPRRTRSKTMENKGY